ncbi:MAG: T9SS type A sorting domain-containing protein, partial [Crocinitomicaceae bacterium]|nr:T9SS type A sorting domain-containing protein [Crocinitomicaceae bacterium]
VLQAGTELTSNELGSNYQWLNCDSSFSLIIGANGIDFTALNSGNYAVEISDEHCIDTSSCYFVSIITSLNNEFANKIILFPNPTNGQLSIALDKVYPVIILRITSLKGELIQKNKYKNTALLEINLEEPPGVYNVTIEADSQKANIRLVKD